MQWRQWIGLTPTQDDFAALILSGARKAGIKDWQYDAADASLSYGEHHINLVNIYREYIQSSRSARAGLMQKYVAMLSPSQSAPVTALWAVAQAHLIPLIRSRYETALIQLKNRQSPTPFPPRAALPFCAELEIVIGYDHGQTVSQVQQKTVEDWGVPLEQIIERARANLRALPAPSWESLGDGVWKLDSAEGYQDAFLQLPALFTELSVSGTPLAMIPNRGVLLATGSTEPNGLSTMLRLAFQSIQEAPWPLSGELFQVTANGVSTVALEGNDGEHLATIKKLDIATIYEAQKETLQAYCETIGDDVFVATFGLLSAKDNPLKTHSWCSWTEDVPTLLPTTDMIALIKDLQGDRQTLFVKWTDAQRIVGHHFKPTHEDPTRTRVDSFPSADEWTALKACAEI